MRRDFPGKPTTILSGCSSSGGEVPGEAAGRTRIEAAIWAGYRQCGALGGLHRCARPDPGRLRCLRRARLPGELGEEVGRVDAAEAAESLALNVTLKFLVLGAVHAAGDVRPVHSEAYEVACVAAMTGPAAVTSP